MATISYEVSKFNPKPSSELLCAICFCVLHEARMCPCHHIFCNACIRRWLENSFTCPSCRRTVSLEQLEVAPPLVLNVLNNLTMDCDYKDKGCDQSILKETFPSHIAQCDFRPASCPHKGCPKKATARELSSHKEECQFRSVQCPKQCQLMLPAYELENHDCFTALQGRVHELNGLLHRHQLVFSWIRYKLNNVQMPEQSPGVQLQAYREMIADINHYWPADQSFPLLLCGNYIAPSVPLASTQASSSRNVNESEASSENPTLEQLVAEASSDGNRPRLFGPRDPAGADGPTAHLMRDTPVRGVVYEEDFEADDSVAESLRYAYFSSDDESETWDSSIEPAYRPTGYHNSAEGNGGDSPYYEDSLASRRYQSPDPPTVRRSRRYDGSTQDQVTDFGDEAAPSPEQLRSGFDEEHSYQTLDSSGHYSSYSENYSSASRSSAAYSQEHQSSSYVNTVYSRHHQNNDHAYQDLNNSNSQTDYWSQHAESRYYTRSRSRSNSPTDVVDFDVDRHSGSYSPAEWYTPTRSGSESQSPGRSHSQSLSSENSGRSYSASQSPSLSRSRSCSTSRERSSSRSLSPDQTGTRTRSCSSSRSYGSSNQTQAEQFSDNDDWMGTDDRSYYNAWTPVWGDDDRDSSGCHWSGSERDLGEVLDDYESFTPTQSPSHSQEQRREAESSDIYFSHDELRSHGQGKCSEDSTERAQPEQSVMSSSSEQVGADNESPCYSKSKDKSKGFQKTRLRSSVSDSAVQEQNRLSGDSSDQANLEEHVPNHSPQPESVVEQDSSVEDSVPQSNKTRAQIENTTCSRNTEEQHGDNHTNAGRQETVECPTAGCSYTEEENSGLDSEKKSENDHQGLSSDQSNFREADVKTLCPETSRSVWESSSDTTSLDYNILTDDSTPKHLFPTDSGAEQNSKTSAEHVAEDSVVEAAKNSDKGRTNHKDAHGSKSSADHVDSNSIDRTANSRSSDTTSEEQRKRHTKTSLRGKGKALRLKRKSSTPVATDNCADGTDDSDSNVCFKRKTKVRLLESSSNSELSPREADTLVTQDDANISSRQINLPSTSHTSSKSEGMKNSKCKRKKQKGLDKKKLTSRLHAQVRNDAKMKAKQRKKQRSKTKSQLPATKTQHDSGITGKEHGAVMPNISSRSVDHLGSQLNLQASSQSTQVNMRPLTTSHGHEATVWSQWAAENPKRNPRNHTVGRQELSERTDNGMENMRLNIGTASSRGRRLSQRPVEAEGRRGSERRVVESDHTRQVEGHRGSRGMSASHQENTPVHTGGRRIMRIDSPHGRMEMRRHLTEENTRTVLIADLPVPPTTLELLNQYDNSDDSDSTWSPSSSRTGSSSTI